MHRRRLQLHRWTTLRRITAGAFLALLVLGRFTWFPWFSGTTSATSLMEVIPFVDPLAALEMMIASRSAKTTLIIGATIVLTFTVLLGPVFCGWVCPLGLLMDVNQSLRNALIRRRPPSPAAPGPSCRPIIDWRLPILGLFIGLAVTARLPVFQILSPINLLVRGVVFAPDVGLAVVVALLLLEYPLPRLWCRRLCPLGALHALVGRFGLLRVRIRSLPHGACWQCSRSCPMGIAVTADHVLAGRSSVDDPSCTRCGACADRCPRDILRLGFRRSHRSASAQVTGAPSVPTPVTVEQTRTCR